jgi:hypothetical protein
LIVLLLVDWSVSGPRRGVGAKARMRVKKPGPPDRLEMEVVAAEPPARSVEESVSAKGHRRTRGTYSLPTRGRFADELALAALDPDHAETQPDKEGKR